MRLLRLLKQDLFKEAGSWVEKGIIDREQARRICALYGIDFDNNEQHSMGYYVLVALGYLFVGLAVITLLSRNWDEIPRALRMVGVIALTLGVNLRALQLYARGQERAGVGLFFLGGLLYGAAIMLIAQIYHLGEHFPDGILWWALGIAPIALLTGSALIGLLAMGLAVIWFFVETGLGFYPLMFPLFLLMAGWMLWRGERSYLLLFVLMLGFGLWAEYTLSWYLNRGYRFDIEPENWVLAASLFLLFHPLALRLARSSQPHWQDYGALLSLWTLRFTIFILVILSFDTIWRGLIQQEWRTGLCLTMSVGATILGALLVMKDRRALIFTLAVGASFNALLIAVILVDDPRYDIVFQIMDNLALIALGIWLIRRGVNEGISHYFYLGVASLLFTGLVRYIDLIGDYVGATVLFAVFAVIMLSAARYWRGQKEGRA